MTAPQDRPYTILSCAMSVDGRIDDATEQRLRLSSPADFARVDEIRAGCDAILVGAETVRRDNPRLVTRSEELRERRRAEGRTADLIKATITTSGQIAPDSRFLTTGDAPRIVYTGGVAHSATAARLSHLPDVTVVDVGDPPNVTAVASDLLARGVHRLIVEGGGAIHTAFLTHGLADELRLAVAPFFIGDDTAPTFARPGSYPHDATNPMTLIEVEQLDGVVALHYLLSGARQ
ncbi:dihydrofolate reductase family protein [Lipingzhangella sp. LS1_29]|uniref:Dihydrofolate reductase family protein n=1 Tax=Lipingzhangella rawalii TaxID=2055835 RepID=A0ABU2H7H2_9ACTN|nr:dihydrofolate reductase family protein [Lipingzhangella rawalii]MDS1271251.1 dihydrofolate reductase family protein [Lipingzhangella rawalii]